MCNGSENAFDELIRIFDTTEGEKISEVNDGSKEVS